MMKYHHIQKNQLNAYIIMDLRPSLLGKGQNSPDF